MDLIRVYRVIVDGDSTIWDSLDSAIEYTKAEIINDSKRRIALESELMREATYAALADMEDGA